MKNFIRIICLALVGASGSLSAQPPPSGYRHFTADDGLPSSEVYEVIQDSRGYLWFATDNGVSRFNGYEFQNFGALQGLADPVVFYLQEDSRGRIWMKCMSGLLYYFEKESLHAFAGNGVLDSLKQFSISWGNCNFYVDSTGQVFNSIHPLGLMQFSFTGEGAFLIKDGFSNTVFLQESKTINVSCRNVSQKPQDYAIEQSLSEKNVWQLTLHLGSKSFRHILSKTTEGGHFDSWLFEDQTLVVSGMGKLFGFQEGRLAWQVPYPEQIVAWHQDSRGQVCLGLGNRKGARRYRSVADLPLRRYETMLEGYSVVHTLEDREGGYWFATTEAGVFYLPNPGVEIFNQASGMPFNYVTSVALKNEQEAFIGLDGGGAMRLDASSKKATPLLPIVGSKVADLLFDRQNNRLWEATTDFDIQYFFNGKWYVLMDTLASVEWKKRIGFPARHFHFSHDRKTVWATSHLGFSRIGLNNAAVLYSQRNLDQAVPYNVRTLDACTASTGRTWIGNVNGLFELKNDRLLPLEALHPAFRARIEAIEELPDSTLVLGSKGYGLVFWKGSRLAALTEADGLAANMLENLHLDAKGNLWAGTLNGLNKIRWSWDGKVSVEKITTAHGLPSNEITDVATWGETIWVGTTKGLARFSYPAGNPVSPTPILAAVLADRRSLDLTIAPKLSFWENNLSINYFAINYKMDGHIPYRYRLDGGEWVHTFNTLLNFPSLPPGKRLFEVQAQNEDGVWSEAAAFRFFIRPPWWETWWCWSGLALAGALAVWALIRYRTAQVRHEEQLKTEFYKKLSETEMTALRSQMNPHFIFNCLNSINHFVVRNDSQQAATYISKFSRLMRLVLDNSRLQKVPLEKELEALRLYMDLEAMRFDGKFRYELWLDDEIDAQFTSVPPMLIQPYVENAIWHGLMHKPEGGLVVVDVRQPDENLLHIEITDDGVGRERAAELESKSSLKHKSQGTLITAERLRALNPDNPNSGKVVIEDLVDDEGQPCGTKVVLEIPV